jgi:hypothetical protein
VLCIPSLQAAVSEGGSSTTTLSNQSAETLIELDVLIAERKYDRAALFRS